MTTQWPTLGLPILKRERRPRTRGGHVPEVKSPKSTVPGSETESFEARYAAWGRGTRPEFIVWEYLTKTKKQIEGVDFLFQSSMMGGRMTFGGVVVDFWLLQMSMMWRVQGEYFHAVNVQDRARDMMDRMRLEEMGYTVIDLWANDLTTRGTYVLDLAWRGQELPKAVA